MDPRYCNDHAPECTACGLDLCCNAVGVYCENCREYSADVPDLEAVLAEDEEGARFIDRRIVDDVLAQIASDEAKAVAS